MDYHKAFDQLIAKGFFIGEHIWNFADFMTKPGMTPNNCHILNL